VLAAAVAVAAAVACTGGESSRVTVVPNSLAVVDARTNRLVDDVAVGKNPVAVALGDGSVFVANADDRTVSRIDPQSRRVTDVIGVGTEVRDLAPGFGSLWVAGGNDGTIARVDLASNSVRTFRFGAGSGEPVFWISTGAGAVWATRGSMLLRIDPETNSVVRTRIPAPAGLAAGRGAVWIPTADGRLLRVSPHPNSVSAQALHLVGGPASAPAVGMGALWLAAYAGHGEIQRIDPQAVGISSTNAEAVAALSGTARTPGTPLDVAVGEGAVWAVDGRGVVVRIQPKTMRVAATIATAPTLRSALAAGYGAVWIAVQQPR
jgi:YVTN family beta-propeller protein